MTDKHILRRTTPDDVPALTSFLARTFKENAKSDPAVMRWQYWENPYGGCLGMVIEADGEIVSHSTSIYADAQARGKRLKITVGADGATAEEFRKQGLSVRLWTGMIEELKNEGVAATFGFPGQTTANPRELLGRYPPTPVRLFVLPVSDGWAAERFGLPRAAAAIALGAFRRPRRSGAGELDGVPEDIDSLWARVSPLLPFSVVKDARWWRWRFEQHPHRPYRYFEARDAGRLAAMAVTRIRENRGQLAECVLELLAIDRDAARNVIGAIADETTAGAIALKAPLRAAHAQWARAAGLRVVPRRIEPDAMDLLAQFYQDEHLVREQWAVTWADTDYV